jgi:hypothetical protein
MCTLKIFDKIANRVRPINIPSNIKTDIAPHILKAYIDEIMFIKQVDEEIGVRVNATEEIARLICSMPCFGGTSDEVEILSGKDDVLRMSTTGEHYYQKRITNKHEVIGWVSWFRKMLNNRKQREESKQ